MNKEKLFLYLSNLTSDEIQTMPRGQYIEYLEELLISNDVGNRCNTCNRVYEYSKMHEYDSHECISCNAKNTAEPNPKRPIEFFSVNEK